MEDFTLFDAGAAVVVVVSALLAYSRGLTREILTIAGWVGAAIAAYYLTPMALPFVAEIPYLSDFIGTNCELQVMTAFAGVFVIALILIALFTPLLSGAIQKSAVGGVDAGLGFLFGIARGLLLVLVVLLVYDWVVQEGEGYDVVEKSKTRVLLQEQQGKLTEYIPTDIPEWLEKPYSELMSSCGEVSNDTIAPPEATDTTTDEQPSEAPAEN